MYNVTKNPSNIFGLKYIPTLEPERSDTACWFDDAHDILEVDFSEANRNILIEEIRKTKPKVIVEIGVAYPQYQGGSTQAFIENRPWDCVYFGIDISPKYFPFANTYYHYGTSSDFNLISSEIKPLGPIDILFIDGDHSVKQVIDDWKFAELVAPNGVIVMHDVTKFPGPYCVFDAIDESIFEKTKYCAEDHGIAVIRRK